MATKALTGSAEPDHHGAQTVDRAVAVLRHLAAGGEAGLRLVDLQGLTQLSKPTVHRILSSLARNGMVSQDTATKRYRLGGEIAILGWMAARYSPDLRELCRPAMERLAEESGDTVFLAVPSGHDSVCVDRKTGSYPIKAFTVDVGTRRPLGIGATGIALLAKLDPVAEEQVYASVRRRLSHYSNVDEPAIRAAVKRARVDGYAYSDGHVLPAVRGIGTVFTTRGGVVVGALGLAAIRERMSPARVKTLVAALAASRAQIERRLAAATS